MMRGHCAACDPQGVVAKTPLRMFQGHWCCRDCADNLRVLPAHLWDQAPKREPCPNCGWDGAAPTNKEGLTFDEWLMAAGVNDDEPGWAMVDFRKGWQAGEDPTEWRAARETKRDLDLASRQRL